MVSSWHYPFGICNLTIVCQVEPEIPYATLNDIMDTAEGLVKYCVNQVQGRNGGDVEVIRKIAHTPDSDIEDDIMDTIMRYDFARVSYTRAIEILQKAAVGFAFTPEWGHDLQTEHELFLCKHFNSYVCDCTAASVLSETCSRPVFVTDFPAKIKPFYMKASEKGDPDKKTCASVDLLVPNIGELVGGSERIDDPALLMKSMGDHGVDPSELQWYLDLRRYACPSQFLRLLWLILVRFSPGLDQSHMADSGLGSIGWFKQLRGRRTSGT